MSQPGLDELLKPLREEQIQAVEDAELAAARRDRLVPRLEHLISAAATERATAATRWRWVAGALSAAAAVGLLVAGSLWRLSAGAQDGASTSQTTVTDAPPAESNSLSGGSRLTTDATPASLVTPTGVEILVAPRSSVVLVGGGVHDERVVLVSGRIEAHVPSGTAGRQFSVEAPLAVVNVHGTRFSVETRSSGGAAVTEVEVQEGVVEVVHAGGSARLAAGARWSSAEGGPPAQGRPSVLPSSPRPLVVAPSSASPESSLSQQNALYQSAMEAKRQGRDALVVEKLDQLLRRWPDSPLASEARAERARASARLQSNPQP